MENAPSQAHGDDPGPSLDAIIVGGGPAGSSAAAVLAHAGRRVVLLEKHEFPRYSVGESLIPHCWFPLQRLGLVEALDRADFVVHKHSVQFVSTDGARSTPFYFFEHSDHPSARTWQVVRSEFDELLLDNARRAGADVRLGIEALDFVEEGGAVGGVRARAKDGGELTLRAPITIDATGRDALAQQRMRWKVTDERLRKLAIWTYFRGALRDPGIDEGATTIAYLPEKGWFWYLPLAHDTVSVGVVADPAYLMREGNDLDRILEREAELQPWIREHIGPGEKTRACVATGDFTYRSKHCARDGLVLAGDAFSFIDPVFSSGVFLALHGGVMCGDAVHAALEAGDTRAERFGEYGERVVEAIEAMRALVHAFYDTTFRFSDFFREYPDMRHEVAEVLIGNLHRDFEGLYRAMREYADVPAPLAHGAPWAGGKL